MGWLALVVPIFLSLLALYVYKHKLVWFEVVLPTVICIGVIAIMKTMMISSLTNDTEYLTEYVVKANYYEDWNEYIKKTCSRRYPCGRDSKGNTRYCTQYYDCSYVKYHSEYWEKTTNCNHSYRISQSEYNSIVSIFGNKSFKDLKRRYYTNDGDTYVTKYNNKFDAVLPLSWKQSYTNKTQAARTIFRFKELDSIDKKDLYDYPDIVNREQDACLGCTNTSNMMLRKYNGLWGKKHEIKVFILQMKGDISVAEKQRQYWKNGNKNELIICLGDSWVKTFSWADDKMIEANTTAIFQSEVPFEMKLSLLDKEINSTWKRKHFSDFEYIKVPLKTSQLVWIYCITIIMSIGLLIFGIKNDITQDNF